MQPFPSHTTPPPPKRPKKHFLVWFVLVLFVAYVVYSFLRPLGTFTPTLAALPSATATAVPINWPAGGQAAIGAPGFGVLASQNDTSAVPIASITKIITALTVLQKYPLKASASGPTITLSQQDIDIYNNYVANDGSVVAIQLGEQLTEYQMLQAMLLPSANNIADSLAVWTYGSMSAYKTAAAQFLSDNGLTHTQLGADASGLDPGTISTAGDLVKLGELAVQQPALVDIAAQKQAELPVAGTVYNYNGVLGEDGINGLKTGNNDQDPGAFLFTSSITVGTKNLTVVGAVLNQASLHDALVNAVPLVNSLQAGFTQQAAVTKGQTVATYHAPWGAKTQAVASQTVQLVRWKGISEESRAQVKTISLASATNAPAGTLIVANGTPFNSVPLVLAHPIDKPGLWWRLTHPF